MTPVLSAAAKAQPSFAPSLPFAPSLRGGLQAALMVCALVAAAASPARAQNAAQIARVESGASCPGCNLFQADLSYKDLSRHHFAGARLRQAEMVAATLDFTDFRRADLAFVNAFAARFAGADFSGADLSQANLGGAYFGRANFAGARLAGANLAGADLRAARGLRQTQLDAACGDESTGLPARLHIRPCAARSER